MGLHWSVRVLLVSVFVVLCSLSMLAAGLPTITTLTLSLSSVKAGQLVTLTATVGTDVGPVSLGTVTFLDGNVILGRSEIVDVGNLPPAVLLARFGPGNHSITARYEGNKNFLGSQSTAQPLVVTGTEPTQSTLTATTDGRNYDFNLSVFGFGFPALSGSATVLNLTQNNQLVGSIDVAGPGVSTFLPQQSTSLNTAKPAQITVADFNGDGFPDLAVTDSTNGNLLILLGDGLGGFQLQGPVSLLGSVPAGMVSGEFNNNGIKPDGNADLAIADRNATVRVLLGDGKGNFTAQVPVEIGGSPTAIALEDFDQDGYPDLAVTDVQNNNVHLLTGNGSGIFTPRTITSVGTTPVALAVGDFNGDGFPDLAVANQGSNNVTVLLGDGNGNFPKSTVLSTGSQPSAVGVGDFNGDGILDLAVTNQGDNSVSVFLGDGKGNFTLKSSPIVGKVPVAIAIADFNGDGFADLVVAEFGNNDVRVLLGHGDGTFPTQQTYPLGTSPLSVAVGDFNGDSVPDWATASFLNTGSTSPFLGGTVSTGQLLNVPVYGVGNQNIQSDFTPNGVVFASSLSNTASVLGLGKQTTTTLASSFNPSTYLQPVTFTATVTGNGGSPTGTVDFFGDGNLICTAVQLTQELNQSTATCLIATLTTGKHIATANYSGDSNFAPSQSSPLLQVVNQAQTVTTITANPPGGSQLGQLVTFTATVTGSNGGNPSGTVDFTSDQVALPGCTGVVLVAQLVGSAATCQTSSLALGLHAIGTSYSGDNTFVGSVGSSEYLVSAATTAVTLSVNPSNATAGQVVTMTATVTSLGNLVTAGTVTFFNGTQVLGTVQLVKKSGTATLLMRFGPGDDTLTAGFNGTNSFNSSVSPPQSLHVTGTEPTIGSLTATSDGQNYDFNLSVFGFGFPPLSGSATVNNLTQNGLLLGNINLAGPGALDLRLTASAPSGDNAQYPITVGDFNGDGFPDLATPNVSDNSVRVLLGRGDGTFQVGPTLAVDCTPAGSTVGDFNGDGFLDLAVACGGAGDGALKLAQGATITYVQPTPHEVSVLLGNGDGTFRQQVQYFIQENFFATAIGVGDFNGDGAPDLVVAASDSLVAVLLNNGDGTFTAQQPVNSGSATQNLVVGDFNRDGFLDVAVNNFNGDSVTVLLGDGNGGFQSPKQYQVGSGPVGIAAADFNHDGILDLAVTNNRGSSISVLLGNGDGTFQSQHPYSVPGAPFGIAAADFNGDGLSDLAVSNEGENTVGVLLGNGDGTFQPQQTYTVGTLSFGLAATDLNGDGVPDIAAADPTTPVMNLLLGGTLSAGQITNVPVPGSGTQNIQSAFAPTGGLFAGSLSNVVQVTGFGQQSTTTILSSSVSPSSYLQPIIFTTTVTGSIGGTPTGTVTFTEGANLLCSAVPLVLAKNASTAICQFATLGVGSHNIIASYSGDSNFVASRSQPLGQSVTSAATNTTLTASPASSAKLSQLVTFTAAVSGANGGSPTGTVSFTADNAAIAGCSSVALTQQPVGSAATCQTASLAVGSHTISAAYNGDSNFMRSAGSIPYSIQTLGDFTVLPISPGTVTVIQSFTNENEPFFAQTINVAVQGMSGYNNSVTLSCAVSPALVDGSCVVNLPNSGSLANGNLNTTLTIGTGTTTPVGSYVVTLTAQDTSGLMHSSTLALTVVNYSQGMTMTSGGASRTTVTFPGPPGTQVTSFSCPSVMGTGITGSEDLSKIGGVCTFNPTSVALPNPVLVTISGCQVARLRTQIPIFASSLFGMPALVLLGSLRVRRLRRKRILHVLALTLLATALLVGGGCGGGGGSSQLTPTGQYSVLVQGTGPDGAKYSAVVPVTVTPLNQ